jgi:hypothetical protein
MWVLLARDDYNMFERIVCIWENVRAGGMKHKSYLIDKMIISRFIDLFKFQVSKGHIMRIKEQIARWQIVSCRSNRREHPSNSFIAWTKPKGLVNVTASALFLCMNGSKGSHSQSGSIFGKSSWQLGIQILCS